MKTFIAILILVLLAFSPWVQAETGGPIIGKWQYKDSQWEITAEYRGDGSFFQETRSAMGREEIRGRWRLAGQMLQLMADGTFVSQQAFCQFPDPDTMVLTYPNGQVLRARRVSQGSGKADEQRAAPQAPSTSPSSGRRPPTLLLDRVWEPNEKAFSILVPKGWKTSGGIFNVNPLQTNGPGNSISPKCDFTVRKDDVGTVMFRAVPSWNYADLSQSPTGWSLFKPGQHYQGMPVRPIITPTQFLAELIHKERPQASGLRIIAEVPLPEIAEAYAKKAQAANAQLRQIGIAPTQFYSFGMLVEYTESGHLFREGLRTTIADARGGAFMWSNDDTVMIRAPSDSFEAWKPVLDMIQSSVEMNPQWVAAVTRAMGERAQMALETQRYINRVASEIVENRRKTNAEIRHEQYLLISGQEEYKNPFTGEVERGTSAYQYRWVNNQGQVLYTDENSFDPNRYEEYNTREWKRSQVWDRK